MSEKKDFNQIVRELLECYTQTELSKTTGVDQATISRLKNGKERKGLTYDSGAALVELYEKHKEKKWALIAWIVSTIALDTQRVISVVTAAPCQSPAWL